MHVERQHTAEAADVAGRLRHRMDVCVRDSLRPVALAVAIVYFALGVLFAVTGPEHTALPLSLLASLTGGVCLLVWQVLSERQISAHCAHPVGAFLLALVLSNLLLHVYLVHGPQDAACLSLFVVGVGCLFLSLRWLAGMLVAANALLAAVALHSIAPVDWIEFAFIQVGATALSLLIFALRLRTYRQLELARIRSEYQNAELERVLHRIGQSEARFRMLSESIPVGIFQVDGEGFCTFTNSMWQTITGRPVDGSTDFRWYHAVHPTERQRAIDAWHIAKNNDTSLSGVFRLNDTDGQQRWSELSVNTVRTKLGVSYVGALEDITERKRAEEELKLYADDLKAAKEAQERNTARLAQVVEELEVAKCRAEESTRSKSEFLANMSHEIRTPMTAIMGYTDLLLERVKTEKEQVDSLETIKRNGEHLLQIINDILDISKIEAGKLEIEKVRCSPAGLLSDVHSLMQARAREKGLPLNWRYDGPIPETIETDSTRLRQILINLVANAIKFTDEGSVEIVIRLVERTPQNTDASPNADPTIPMLQIDVVDTGIGLSDKQISCLFQPFTQADSSMSRRFGGTGLGLTISKRLADMLGGTIEVVSAPGKGSCFSIFVPTGTLQGVPMRGHPANVAAPNPDKAQSKPVGLQLPEGCRILLAEDGADNQRLISFLLQKKGAEVTVAENGQRACEIALLEQGRGRPFDVILMDMQMPVLDGYGATRRLRELGYEAAIVALTAHAMRGDREKCLAAGCDDYTAKPINRETLFSVIHKHVERARNAPARQFDGHPTRRYELSRKISSDAGNSS